MIPFDRQQSTRRSENAWSPQPPSPNRNASSVKTLTPDDLVGTERLDSDHDISTITWYPFDWRTGGTGSASSPLRKSLIHPLLHSVFCLGFVFPSSINTVPSSTAKNPLQFHRSFDYPSSVTQFTHSFRPPDLDSPVNRAQAHNPFGKRRSQQSITSENNADFGACPGSSPPSPRSPMFTRVMSPLELPVLSPLVSPSASVVSLSPAAVPLPSPSPDETAELDSVN